MRRKLILVLVLSGLAAAIFLLRESRRIETRPVGSLQTIKAAQFIYARTHPDKVSASSLAKLGPSPGAELIDAVLASGRKSGYLFILSTAPPDFSGRIMHYAVVARPQQYRSGRRNFFMDESGVERFTTEDRPATINDPPRTLE
jgi:hypothetical protein